MSKNELGLTVVINNESAMVALEEAIVLAEEIAEDAPWNCEAKELVEKLQHVVENIELIEDADAVDELDCEEFGEAELVDDMIDGMEEFADYIEDGGELPFDPEHN